MKTSTPSPTLYGAAYSVYVRAARLALVEKGVEYALVEVDIFGGAVPGWYAKLHPFKRIPAFEHDGFRSRRGRAVGVRLEFLAISRAEPASGILDPRQVSTLAIFVLSTGWQRVEVMRL